MANKHGQTLDIPLNASGDKVGITIAEPTGAKADNLPLSTWGASFILAEQLHKIDTSAALQNARQTTEQGGVDHAHQPKVLEIGAGTALVGITAALLWKSSVVLTDLPKIVPGIAANISANQAQLTKAGTHVQCGTLDWTSPNTLTLQGPAGHENVPLTPAEHKFPIILAADVLYDEDHPPLLQEVVRTWLAPGPESRFVQSYPLRIAYLDIIRELWQRYEEAGLECVQEGQVTGDESWDEEAPYEFCVWRWRE